MQTKTCTKCQTEKSLDQFNKHSTTKDKLQVWCGQCKNKSRREQRQLKIGCYANEYEKSREQHLAICHRRYHRYKQVVFEHYSPSMCCVKCGFQDMRALSIDHINSDGAEHRKKLGGKNIHKWLIENNFPPQFQVLCMNCQFIKRHEKNEYRTHIPEKISAYIKTTTAGIAQIRFNTQNTLDFL